MRNYSCKSCGKKLDINNKDFMENRIATLNGEIHCYCQDCISKINQKAKELIDLTKDGYLVIDHCIMRR